MGVRSFQPDGKGHDIRCGKSALFIALRPCFPAVKAVLRPAYRGDGNLDIRRIGAVCLIGERGCCRGDLREVHRDALWRPFLMVFVLRHHCIKCDARSRLYALKYIFRLPFAVIPHAVDCSLCGRYRIGIGLPVIGMAPAYVRYFTSGRLCYGKCLCHQTGIIPFPGDGDGCCPCVLMIAVRYREVICGNVCRAVGNGNPCCRRPGTHCHRRLNLGAGISISPCHLRYRYASRIQVPAPHCRGNLHGYAVKAVAVRRKCDGHFLRCPCGRLFTLIHIADSPCACHSRSLIVRCRTVRHCHFPYCLPIGSGYGRVFFVVKSAFCTSAMFPAGVPSAESVISTALSTAVT